MMAQALVITSVVMLAVFFYLLDACRFLIPYRDVLIRDYGREIAVFAGLVFLNLFAVIYQGTSHPGAQGHRAEAPPPGEAGAQRRRGRWRSLRQVRAMSRGGDARDAEPRADASCGAAADA